MSAKRILLVDDEENIIRLLTVVLKGCGYEVDTAANGLEGLKKLQVSPPDLVILDVNMPKLDGWDMLAAMRAMEPCRKVKVIMCTSKSLVADVDKADGLGATAYIPKPFDIDRVVKKVKSLLGD